MAVRKPVLYIIHGWTYTTAPWARTIALLEKGGIKVQMLHVPGLTTGSKKVWTIEDYVKWANRNLPDGAIALGHSNGGRILLNLCSQQPEKLKHLILLDAAGVYEVSNKRDFFRTVSKKLGFLKNIPGLTRIWHKITGSSDYARAPENMKKTLTNMLDSDKNLGLGKVTTPTSILWGANDTVTPPHQAEIMHQQIPNSTLEIFPKWTHAPYLSHPNELARAIQKVLRHPPIPEPVTQAAATSASLSLKKSAGPDFSDQLMKEKSVAPNGVTKLELMSGKASPLAGLMVSDAEGAAVKYETKPTPKEVKPTDVASNSASANFRRAQAKAPDLDAGADSASATLKKSRRRPAAESASASSASLVLRRNHETESKGILAELAGQTDETVGFETLDARTHPAQIAPQRQIISTASVPKKPSRLTRARQKVQTVTKKSRQKPQSAPKSPASKPSSKPKGRA